MNLALTQFVDIDLPSLLLLEKKVAIARGRPTGLLSAHAVG